MASHGKIKMLPSSVSYLLLGESGGKVDLVSGVLASAASSGRRVWERLKSSTRYWVVVCVKQVTVNIFLLLYS